MRQQSNNSNGTGYPLWSSEPTFSIVTTSEVNRDFNAPSTSGSPYQNRNYGVVNHLAGGNKNGRGEEDDDTESWFSSAVWSFLESIPTNPASASEGLLINRAGDRMSSLSKARVNARNINIAATSRNSGKSRIGFLCISLLGVICAILWMLTGTSRRVIGLCS